MANPNVSLFEGFTEDTSGDINDSKRWTVVSRDWSVSVETVNDGINPPNTSAYTNAMMAKDEYKRAVALADEQEELYNNG